MKVLLPRALAAAGLLVAAAAHARLPRPFGDLRHPGPCSPWEKPSLAAGGQRRAPVLSPPPPKVPVATKGAARRASPFAVVVRAEQPQRGVSQHKLSVEEVRQVAGAQNDPVRAVQSLPGVARPSFVSGALIVWGSAPVDTRVYVDGVPIPRVYHFGALRSVINAEFIQSLTFQPGAYGADYGRGLGGMVNVETRAPRSDRLHGSVTLDLIDGLLTLEGPLTRDLHIAAAARVSWIGSVLPLFTGGSTNIKPFYYDYQLGLRYRLSSRDDLDLLVFGSGDTITTSVTDNDPVNDVSLTSKLYFARARLRWSHRFSPAVQLTMTPAFGVDTFTFDTGGASFYGSAFNASTATWTGTLRAELAGRLPLLDRVARSAAVIEGAVGVDFEAGRSTADLLLPLAAPGSSATNPQSIPGSQDAVRDAAGPIGGVLSDALNADSYAPSNPYRLDVTSVQAAPYLITRFLLFRGRLVISPQLRLAAYSLRAADREARSAAVSDQAFTSGADVEPRLFVRGEVVRDHLWLKGALGLTHQLPQADEVSAATGNPALRPQQGITYVAGLDAALGGPLPLQIEAQGFYKDLRDLVAPAPSDPLRYSNNGSGRVYGGELLLRLRPSALRPAYGWAAYTLSRSERRDDYNQPLHLFEYDQTHILSLVAGYRLPWGLQVAGRFRYISGNPAPALAGAVRYLPSNDYVAIAGAAYSIRLPPFHELDLRIDKTFVFNRFRLGIFLDVQNVYNRRNPEGVIYGGYQLTQSQNVAGLPIFPDLGVRADF